MSHKSRTRAWSQGVGCRTSQFEIRKAGNYRVRILTAKIVQMESCDKREPTVSPKLFESRKTCRKHCPWMAARCTDGTRRKGTRQKIRRDLSTGKSYWNVTAQKLICKNWPVSPPGIKTTSICATGWTLLSVFRACRSAALPIGVWL